MAGNKHVDSIIKSAQRKVMGNTYVPSGRGQERDTYKYQFKIGNEIVHRGITNDLERREQEHRRTHGEKGHIKQVGRRTTKEAARTWEKDKGYS